MTITQPQFLFLLLVLVAVVIASHRKRVSHLRWVLPLRVLLLTLLILSLAGLAVPGLARSLTVIFLVDASDSIDARARQVAAGFLNRAVELLPPQGRAGLVVFAGRPLVVSAPTNSLQVTGLPPAPEPTSTDIGAALQVALDLLPAEGGRRIILLSDGGHNAGDLEASLRRAQAERVEVSVFPLTRLLRPEAFVDRILAPDRVNAGELFSVTAVVESTDPQTAQVRLIRDGRVLAERSIALGPGQTFVSFTQHALAPGLLRYEVEVLPARDGIPENNRGLGFVRVEGKPEVLYLSDSPGPLQEILARQGFTVHTARPEELPSAASELLPYRAVVLDDVPATGLSRMQMEALRNYVGEMGGGLVAFGGPHSFGAGGYHGTPLEETLPVSMDVRHRLVFPSLAIVLVLDTSGSMGGFGNEPAKVELAKEAAASVVDLLREQDLIGVITFDQEYRWLVPLVEASRRKEIEEKILQLRAGGGTNMYPALAAAKEALETAPARVKHVIVLSDGQTDPGEFGTLVQEMAQKKITVTAVAIGNDADTRFMRQLSMWGRGRYYYAKDPYTIPLILAAEAMVATKAYIVEEPFTPEIVEGGEILSRTGPLPPLGGYVATTPKPASQVILTSPQKDPVLAAWQYGLGRAVAFTSDARARWTESWLASPDAVRIWTQAVRWVLRREAGGLEVATAVEGRKGKIVLDARDLSGNPIVDVEVHARLLEPSGGTRSIRLVQTSPGWYEGEIDLHEEGGYVATVEVRKGGRVVGVKTVTMALPYSPELRAEERARFVLGRIVEATGGKFLADPAQAVELAEPQGRQAKEIWRWLVVGSLVLLVGEVATRKAPAIRAALVPLAGALRGERWKRETWEDEEDRAYTEADRWRVVESAREEMQISSMEHAARLYIAKLKMRQGLPPKDEEGELRPR
ncbi:MAG: VWA domain-containing protein [Armatimonadota bacterium]|nr:VWA domain-containing protein [Armatimonadota bacterium]